MTVNLSAFKAYDIRGRIPDEINAELIYQIGRAYAAFIKPKKVAVGRDIRLTSEEFAQALIRGLTDSGVDVLDIGLCGTEGVYFATFHYQLDGGVMITASHNPSDYNGFRPNPGAKVAFRWNVGTPQPAAAGAPAGGFASLADYVKSTGQDQHSLTLDYDVFVNVTKLDRDPKTVQRLHDFKDSDFRLKPGSVAIDRGVVIPNINDGFAGKAPDLGALEAGQPVPVYGPRQPAR